VAGLQAETLLGSVNHGARGTDFGLPNGAAGLDIEDDRVLGIDQIIGGVGEERVALVSTGPLRRRIGWRDELGLDRAGCTESGGVQGCQILTHGMPGILAEIVDVVAIAWNRTLLVGIGSDQAGIDSKPFATHQALTQAPVHHRLEQVPQDIALTEAAMPVAREGRVIRHLAVEPQPAEPAIGQVQMYFLAQAPLRAYAHAIAHDQHPHHQLGIDRRTTDATVKRLQF
jgi:hypothetical protein